MERHHRHPVDLGEQLVDRAEAPRAAGGEHHLGRDFTYNDIDLSNLADGSFSIGCLTWVGASTGDPIFQVSRVSLGFEPDVLLRGETPHGFLGPLARPDRGAPRSETATRNTT